MMLNLTYRGTWLRKLSLACAVVAFCCALTSGAEGAGESVRYTGFLPRRRNTRAGLPSRQGRYSYLSQGADEGAEESNPLLDFWGSYKTGPGVDKWVSYFDTYHQYFKRFRQRKVRILQVGVQSGGDIRMWQHYFVGGLEYYGIDINPACRQFESEPSVAQILIGDQGSPSFWREVIPKLPMFDIIIDDGGHSMNQQITTFKEVYPTLLAPGGVFLVEDTATSLWGKWGGSIEAMDERTSMGSRRPSRELTFLEFSQSLLKNLYWQHANRQARVPKAGVEFAEREMNNSPFWRKIKSIHFHNQIVVFLEGDVTEGNRAERRGDKWIPYRPRPMPVEH